MTLEELRAARPDLPDDILRSALAAYDEEQTIDPAITRGNYRRQDSLGVLMGTDVATGIDGDSATTGARFNSAPRPNDWRAAIKEVYTPVDGADDFDEILQKVKGGLAAPAKQPKEMGDLAAGAKTALQQMPQLGYGLLAGAGAVGESLFGEGGVSSGLKKYGLEKYQAKGEEIQQYQKDIYELDTAIGKAKEGDIGALVDWAQYGLGYGVTQLATAFATGGLGAIGGKMALPTVVKSVMGGAVEKSAEAIARNQLGKAATAEAVASLAATDAVKAAAAKSVATNIGAGLAVGAQNVGMEGGEIFSDLASQATKEGRVLTGEEIARGFGATIAAAGMETAVDMLGLGALSGKIPLGGKMGLASRAAVGGAAGVLAEGGTEYIQTGIEQYGKGQDIFTDEAARERFNAAGLGAIGGGAVGAGIGAISRARNVDEAIAAFDATQTQGSLNATSNLSQEADALQATIRDLDQSSMDLGARREEMFGQAAVSAQDTEPLKLGHQAGEPLVVFKDGSTMTRAEYEAEVARRDQARLDGMVQDAPLPGMMARATERAADLAKGQQAPTQTTVETIPFEQTPINSKLELVDPNAPTQAADSIPFSTPEIKTDGMTLQNMQTPQTEAARQAALTQQQQLADEEQKLTLPRTITPEQGSQLTEVAEDALPAQVRPTAAFLKVMSRILGKQIKWVTGAKFDGMTKDSNTIYLSADGMAGQVIDKTAVFGHEFWHTVKKSHKDIWNTVKNVVDPMFDDATSLKMFRDYFAKDATMSAMTDEQVKAWMQEERQAGESNRDFMLEEFISDLGGNRFGENDFWKDVFSQLEQREGHLKAVTMIRRFVKALTEAIDKLLTVLKMQGFKADNDITAEQLTAVKAALTKGMADYLEATRYGTKEQASVAGEEKMSGPKKTPGSDVGHKRTKSGEYVGAPPGMTASKLGKLRNTLRALIEEGKDGRMWYEESSDAILASAEGDRAFAEKISGLLAIYSPNATVSGNATMGIKALYQWANGEPIKVRFPDQDRKAQAWMDGTISNDDALKIKTGNFHRNLMRKIDEENYGYDKQGATIDMWMARVFGYGSKAIGSEARYYFAERETKQLAKELGWEPQQVQAALWVAIKARVEAIRNDARDIVLKKGWVKEKVKNGNISYEPVNAEAREKYEGLILKMALAADRSVTDEFIHKGVYNFATALKERVGQLSWEAMPGKTTGVLPGIFDAPLEQQAEYLAAIDAALRDENGGDLIAKKLDLPVLQTSFGPSAWQMNVGAGAQTEVVIPTDREQKSKNISVNQNAKDLLNTYAAIRGYVLAQEAVVWHYPIFDAAKKNANGVQLDFGRDPTHEEVKALYQAIYEASGRDDWAPAYVPGVGVRVLNFSDVPNTEFHKLVKKALSDSEFDFGEVGFQTFKSDGDYVGNDWEKNRGGEDYRQRISRSGRSDIQGWVESELRPRVERVNQEFSDKYGWGKAKFSLPRSDAGSAQRAGGLAAEGSGEVRGYGTAAPGAVSVQGFHYSTAERSQLDGRYYGTGTKGAEYPRVMSSRDPRIKERIYFYVDAGRGITPEQGVGSVGHTVNLNNVYDGTNDTWLQANISRDLKGDEWMNAFESAVIDNGFDGYVSDFGTQRAAVLLGRHSVKVQPTQATSGAVTESKPAQENAGADAVAKSRVLPGGKMSGADWKRMVPAVVPGADVSMLEDGKDYYKDDVVAAMRGVKFSLGRQTETTEFKRWSNGNRLIGTNESHDMHFAAGEPVVVRLFHGTTGDFSVFDKALANPESDMGAGFYFTNDDNDVGANYAGEGPDLTNKLAMAADRIASETDRYYNDPDVIEEAKAQLSVENLGTTMLVFVRFDNPIVIGGAKETVFTYEPIEDENGDITDEQGTLVDFIMALRDVASQYEEGKVDEVVDLLLNDGGDVSASRLVDLVRESEDFGYYSNDEGVIVAHEIIRETFERMGFDGIIDQTVNKKFGTAKKRGQGMKGVGASTKHFIAFSPTQIKSATGNRGTFDGSNPDIRYSTQRTPSASAQKEIAAIEGRLAKSPSDFVAKNLENIKRGLAGEVVRDKTGALLAPNGRKSKLTEQQYLQVRTPEFMNWFGDWLSFHNAKNGNGVWEDDAKSVSKVVDENGEPMVVYHGSEKGGFRYMRPEKGDKHRSPMIFAAKTRDTARSYSGRGDEIDLNTGLYEDAEGYDRDENDYDQQRGVYSLFLNIRNPNEADFEGANWDGQVFDKYEVKTPGDPWDAENIYGPNGERFMDYEMAERVAEENNGEIHDAMDLDENTNSVAEDALRYGNDGAIIRSVIDDGGRGGHVDTDDVFVIFDSNQAKSATQNVGTFSTTNDDLRYSTRRAINGEFDANAFIAPDIEPWLSNKQLVDLAFVDGKPIRLNVGYDNGPGSGKGAVHLVANAERGNGRRNLDQVTDDDGENVVRTVLNALAKQGASLHKDKNGSYALRVILANKSLILADQGDHYNIITMLPSAKNKWGDAEWVGRLTFPTTTDATSAEPLSMTSAESSLADQGGQGTYVSTKFDLKAPYGLNQPTSGMVVRQAAAVNQKKRRTPDAEAMKADGLKLSPSRRLIGDSGRQYDAAQRQMFKNVGRDIEYKNIFERTKDYLTKDFAKKMATGIVDQFRGLRDLGDGGQAYMLARLSKGTAGAFDALLHHGKLSIKDGAYDADLSGGFIDRLGTPLNGELDDVLWWIASNRAEKLSKQDRENLFTDQDIAAGKSLASGTTDWDYTIQTGPAKGKVTRDRTLIYADANRVFNEFQKNTLDMAEQSGLIDGASRQFWESEFYVPFYRVSEEDGEFIGTKMGNQLVRQSAFKKLKGGTDKLNSDLLSNTLLNMSHLIDAAAKNRAAKAALEAAENVGAAHKAQPGDKKTVWFAENGQKVEYKVTDPFVMTAITSLEYAGMRNPIMDALSKFKHWLTIGVTASPAFKVRNLIRDSVQAIGTSDLGYNPITNVVAGFKQTKRDSQEYVSALASGALIRFGTMLEGNESARTRQLIKQGVKNQHILDSEPKWRQFYDKFLEPGIAAYNELGNRSEEINRAALYNQLIKKGVSHAEAALMARDLMDFSMQGSFNTIRFLSQVVPFLNARLQGMYKLGRSAKDNPRKMAVVTGAVAMASIALMLAYDDDEDWKRREDWDLNNFFWFKFGGVAWRIPRPFEIGAVASIAERGLQYMIDDEMTGERFRSVMGHLLKDNLAMNPVPQMVKPIIDLYANKDSFSGRPIETMSMEKIDPTERYTANTSMVARGASKALLGAASPVQIDHLVRGYFGWLGTFVVGGADMAVRAMSDEPTKPTMDYFKFATQGIAQEVPSNSSRYVTNIYEQAKELEQAYGTWRRMLKEGRTEDANEYAEDNKEKLQRYKQVESVKRAEAKFSERIRMVERSNIDPDEKKSIIAAINAQKDAIARRLTPGYSD